MIKADKAVARYGRMENAGIKNMDELAELFKFLKLTPRQFDPLITMVRTAVEKIRKEERNVMRLCIRHATYASQRVPQSLPR